MENLLLERFNLRIFKFSNLGKASPKGLMSSPRIPHFSIHSLLKFKSISSRLDLDQFSKNFVPFMFLAKNSENANQKFTP